MDNAAAQPSDTIALEQSEKDQILSELRKRGAPGDCDLCGKNNWYLSDHLITPTVVRRTGSGVSADINAPLHTSGFLICLDCGNSKIINVGVLGLRGVLNARVVGQP